MIARGRGGGGKDTPKSDDVIYEQPLTSESIVETVGWIKSVRVSWTSSANAMEIIAN